MGSGASSAKAQSSDVPPIATVGEVEEITPNNLSAGPDEDSKGGTVLRQCTDYLKTATATGGRTVRRSPHDAGAFKQTSGQLTELRPEFLRCLERLHATETYTDDAAMESILTVCRMSDLTDTELADELVERRYPELFAKIWKAVYHEDIYTSQDMRRQYVVLCLLKQATNNFTHVSWRLCAEMGGDRHGIVPQMAKEFDHPLMTLNALKDGVKKAVWDSPRETLKKTVNVLANIIRGNIDNKPVFRQANIVPHLQGN